MTPIPALNPNLASILPNAGMTPPEMEPLSANGIQMPAELAQLPATQSTQAAGNSFGSMLSQFVSDVNSRQVASAQTVNALQSGQNVPLNHAVVAMEEANVSFQLMVEVRNRLLDSYQEIMRMQV